MAGYANNVHNLIYLSMKMSTAKLSELIAISPKTDPDWLALLRIILEDAQCSVGTIHTFDASRNSLIIIAQIGIPASLLPKVSVIPMGKGMAGIAAERKEPVQICNLQTDESGIAKPSARETKVEGSIAIPIMFNDTLFGTLGLAKPVPYEFPPHEVDSFVRISGMIGEILARK